MSQSFKKNIIQSHIREIENKMRNILPYKTPQDKKKRKEYEKEIKELLTEFNRLSKLEITKRDLASRLKCSL